MDKKVFTDYKKAVQDAWQFYQQQMVNKACNEPVNSQRLATEWTTYLDAESLLLDELSLKKADYKEAPSPVHFVVNASNIGWPEFPDQAFQQQFDAVGGIVYQLTKLFFDRVTALRQALITDYLQPADEPVKTLTIRSIFTKKGLQTLHKKLTNGGFIKKRPEADFIYFLSGQPINGTPKLKWEKSKNMAAYLFTEIATFDLQTINSCFSFRTKKSHGTTYTDLQHNDNRKKGYREIDDIIKLCDRKCDM